MDDVPYLDAEPHFVRSKFLPAEGIEPRPAPLVIAATPFVLRDPKLIPPREWLYDRHLIRGFVSATVAPGGLGKSSLLIVEALAMVTGRPLLGVRPPAPLRAWFWNGEDPDDEIERRVAAACLHFGIASIDGLFVDSGRNTEIVVAREGKDGALIARPVVDALVRTIRERGIDVLIVDPFVSTHAVRENDNAAINVVVNAWRRVAHEAGCAVELVHHVRKGQTGQSEYTVDDGRGAVALRDGARSARVLNVMPKEVAEKFGIDRPRSFFSASNGKANMAPPPEGESWYRFVSVPLGQGDDIGVVTAWQPPDTMHGVTVGALREIQAAVAAGRWRENHQAKDWVGHPIAAKLGLDPVRDRKRITSILKTWLDAGMFVTVEGEDEKRMKRPFVEVGQLASD